MTLLLIRTVLLIASTLMVSLAPAASAVVQHSNCQVEYATSSCSGNCCYAYVQYYCDEGTPQYCDCYTTYCDTPTGSFYLEQCSCV
jgi:hypothetical protein